MGLKGNVWRWYGSPIQLTWLIEFFTLLYYEFANVIYIICSLLVQRKKQYQHHTVPSPTQLNTLWPLSGVYYSRNQMHVVLHYFRWLSFLKNSLIHLWTSINSMQFFRCLMLRFSVQPWHVDELVLSCKTFACCIFHD